MRVVTGLPQGWTGPTSKRCVVAACFHIRHRRCDRCCRAHIVVGRGGCSKDHGDLLDEEEGGPVRVGCERKVSITSEEGKDEDTVSLDPKASLRNGPESWSVLPNVYSVFNTRCLPLSTRFLFDATHTARGKMIGEFSRPSGSAGNVLFCVLSIDPQRVPFPVYRTCCRTMPRLRKPLMPRSRRERF